MRSIEELTKEDPCNEKITAQGDGRGLRGAGVQPMTRASPRVTRAGLPRRARSARTDEAEAASSRRAAGAVPAAVRRTFVAMLGAAAAALALRDPDLGPPRVIR